jgi:hypothetical protein
MQVRTRDKRFTSWKSERTAQTHSSRGLHICRHVAVVLCVVMGFTVVALPAYAAVPANDDFNNATAITGLPFNTEIDTSQATRANDDPDDCVGSNSVWFSYTTSEDTRVELDTSGSDYSALTSVWTGQRGSLQQVACAGLGPMRFTATGGQTYHIAISGEGEGGILSFAARLAPPAPRNDERTDAKKIGRQLPFIHEIDTSEATFATTDPRCGGRRASVWYVIRRQRARRLQIDTLKSDFDTSLSVYSKANGTLTRLVCNDNAARSQQSRVRVSLKARKTYYIMVTARRSGGNLVLRVKDAPRPFHVRLHIGRGHVRTVTGEAIVRGTVRCNRASDVYLQTSIKQAVGSHVVSGSFSTDLKCHGLVRWKATFASQRAFRPRAAKVSAKVVSARYDKHDVASKIVQLTSR